jgi:type I restriction enzyme M protein
VFETDGTLKDAYLDRLEPDCIEAADFNLSASRFKPFTFEVSEQRPPADLIAELDTIHEEILQRLGELRRLVEGKA